MTKSELILEQFRRYANSADIMSKLHSREILSGYGNSELNCIDCIGRMKHPNAARIAVGDAPEDDGVTPCADNFL